MTPGTFCAAPAAELLLQEYFFLKKHDYFCKKYIPAVNYQYHSAFDRTKMARLPHSSFLTRFFSFFFAKIKSPLYHRIKGRSSS